MSADADLQTLLAADAAVIALVGEKIAQDRAEQDWTRPFVIYTRTGTESFPTLDSSAADEKVSFTVESWAATRAAANAIADAVSAAIDGGDNGTVINRSTEFDPERDEAATTLLVEWWT